jgi:two-component system cell cycle sensor histidine kinase PleC
MFNYLRHIATVSLFVVAIAAWFVGGYFKSVASEDLMLLARQNNSSLVQSYINTIWQKNHDIFLRLQQVPVEKWGNYKEFRALREESFGFFHDMSVVEISMYTQDGKLIFSTNSSKQAGDANNNILSGDDIALTTKGVIASQLKVDKPYFLPNNTLTSGTLVRTLVPITAQDYVPIVADNTTVPVEAVLELYYNVTPQWERINGFQMIATVGVILIFIVLVSVLIYSSSKAETIIAKQHEINLELAATAAAAEADNRDKSQFLANISHELRTPLNAIIGFSEIIKNESANGLTPQYQEYIRDIHYSGVHLLSLINDILDFSKAEAGKLEVNITEIDGIKMVKNSLRLVVPRAESAQVSLIEDLPSKHFTLQTDAKKLKQVLLNLLSNAVKFTPADGTVTVSAWHDAPSDTVTFIVADTGIGISLKDIPRVMSPFGQVDSTLARRYEGTGLGLPLSKKFVETLGGQFIIESEVGKGTSVKVILPRTFKHGSAATARSSS